MGRKIGVHRSASCIQISLVHKFLKNVIFLYAKTSAQSGGHSSHDGTQIVCIMFVHVITPATFAFEQFFRLKKVEISS